MPSFTHRIALPDDLEALRVLMHRAIEHLQSGFLSSEEVRASHRVMGLHTQLIRDGTYFLVLDGETIAGCGGWSYRATLYGRDASVVAREPERLNPAADAARIPRDVHQPGLCQAGDWPYGAGAVRGRGVRVRFPPRRDDGDLGRRTSLSGVRLHPARIDSLGADRRGVRPADPHG